MIIRRATQVQIRAALDVANEQFGGNLRFQELEDLHAPRTPKFKSVSLRTRVGCVVPVPIRSAKCILMSLPRL